MQKFDAKDLRILRALQRDSGTAVADLATQIGLSINACWRRVKRLQEEAIDRQVAILEPERFGFGLTAFVSVRTNEHNEQWLQTFSRGIHKIDEVVEFYRLSGQYDYLLKILVKDVADYDKVYKRIIKIAPLSDVSSSFAMERIKSTTALPI
ncbi:MAG: Lrp/AsnC family transcriptional regulator [Pseudomonadales bacterium]|jgi:Lrp/AsnC family transcriptional regulator|nr:Lrp/AsnC family transcriptional regulator [Pseudomonadales bacterium]MEC7076626.1 Lrp/AsnC family transcriptional regulator [Pseudomonadota bacterium]MEC7419749.1 Lrp/AsnC family transcriptional regulator [Pseudomonadota bacterium]MEC7553225.1 Lrp/AsnC family transcriptional regulator [Pseudomonadota bacterium]MEC7969764.1 Lrp/AsnC family transcriptional regulator [Pseudomonadota bacterium]|tara:strand:+ start:2968 stop:3423 length:456 start_codon:yes stop_codon:yes gene_type:complete